MAYVIDTSAYSVVYRGEDTRLAQYFNGSEQLYVPVVVLGELRAGFKAGNKDAENSRVLEAFLNNQNVEILYITDVTTKKYAEIFAKLREKGRPIGTNDLWIAAICLEHGLPLLTKDSDYAHVSGLQTIGV